MEVRNSLIVLLTTSTGISSVIRSDEPIFAELLAATNASFGETTFVRYTFLISDEFADSFAFIASFITLMSFIPL